MTVQLVIELNNRRTMDSIVQAVETYKARLRLSIERARDRLANFERRYDVETTYFLREMAAEDLAGGDIEYVEWAGQAKLLEGLEAELRELEDAQYRLQCPLLPQSDHKHTESGIELCATPTLAQVLRESLS